MKLNHQESEVLTNSTKESKFTINASAQAFKILSSGIYEHKIAAIVRELSCNAYDAHVEAGNTDQPFKVVLPNSLHPYFEIEDYGIGLDDDGVRTVYTSYFTSTKQNSNDSIGAFGLGSKTPFSYTNTFNIRSRKDGVERLYSAYLGSDSAPAVNMLSERETDEANGIKITVPVRDEHFGRFRYEAEFILSMFKVKPIVPDPTFDFIIDGVAEELETGKIVVKKIDNNASQLYTSRLYAVMGGVCYGIDWSTISSSLDQKYLTYLNKVVIGNTYSYSSSSNVMFLQFDIGELEPAASRETLSMTPETERLVIDRIESAVESLVEEDQKEVENQDHAIKAIKFVNEKYNMGNLILPMFTYNGLSLNEYNQKRFWFFRNVSGVSAFRYHHGKVRAFYPGTLSDVIPNTDCSLNIVYVPHGSSSVGFVKYSKLYLNSLSRIEKLIVLKDPISESVKRRFEQYIGVDVNWVSLDDLKVKYKPSVTTSTSSKPVKQKVTDKPTKVEIFGKHVKYDSKQGQLYSLDACRVDCNSHTVYYVNDIDEQGCIDKLNVYENGIGSVTYPEMSAILKAIDIKTPIVIMKRNANNRSKMDSNNVKSISVLIEEFKKNISVTPEDIAYQSMYNASGAIGNNLNLHRIYENTNPKVKVKGYENEIIPSDQISILYSIFEKEVDVERSKIDRYSAVTEARDKLVEEYPLLGDLYNNTGVYERAKEYVSLIDSKHEEV